MNMRTFIALVSLTLAAPVLAQHGGGIQNNAALNTTEILLGLAAAVMAFQAALAYRDGKLGRGMTWVAVGMVIMAIGHFILVVRRLFSFDPLGFLGETGSFVAFSLAVFLSFLASAFGFWTIRKSATEYP
jgi:hypothetical protein